MAAPEPSALRWRCRRGLKELDLLLEGYLCRRWPEAPAAERAEFARLLELSDPELADLCLAGERVGGLEPAVAALVRQITLSGRGHAPA